jgi:hypothetical protein
VRDECLPEQREAIPYRFCSVDPRDRISIVDRFKSSQARRQDARSSAVSGIYQRIIGEKITKDGIPAAAAKRIAEHEHIAAAQPRHRKPSQITTKAVSIIEVAAEIQLGSVEPQFSQRGQLTLNAAATDVAWRIIHGVRDDDSATVIATDEGREVLRMIAQPKGRQIQTHLLACLYVAN